MSSPVGGTGADRSAADGPVAFSATPSLAFRILTEVAETAAVSLAAAAASAAAQRLTARLPRAAKATWERTNHAGSTVTLLEGPAWIGGAVSGLAVGAVFRRGADGSSAAAGSPIAGLTVTVAAGALGALDDLAGTAARKGLRGHLGALRRREVTTGAVKVAGLALTGLVGAVIADGRRWAADEGASGVVSGPASTASAAMSTVVGGAVVAGAANAANLFDLRPGRALKVVMGAAGPLALTGSTSAAAALGTSAGVIGDDLAGVSMLGDTGANAAGALVGLALVERTGLRGRLIALGVLTALTLASERISFTKVIESNGLLRRIDEWGRVRP